MDKDQSALDLINKQLIGLEQRLQAIESNQRRYLLDGKQLDKTILDLIENEVSLQHNNNAKIFNARYDKLKEAQLSFEAERSIYRDVLQKLKEKEEDSDKLDEKKVLKLVDERIEKKLNVLDTFIDPLSDRIKEVEKNIGSELAQQQNLLLGFNKRIENINSTLQLIEKYDLEQALYKFDELLGQIIRKQSEMMSRIESLEKKSSSGLIESPKPDKDHRSTSQQLQPYSRHGIIFFAETPQKNYFSRFHSEYKAQITLFCIYQDREQNDNEATYLLVEKEDNFRYAFNFTDSLRDAIDFLSTGLPNDFSTIKMEPGKLIKDADVWKISQKLKISWS